MDNLDITEIHAYKGKGKEILAVVCGKYEILQITALWLLLTATGLIDVPPKVETPESLTRASMS